MGNTYAGDISVTDAWDVLRDDSASVLVDVRTAPEWGYVGTPNLDELDKEPIFISWLNYPNYDLNQDFLNKFDSLGIDKAAKLLFLCKIGGRSMQSAAAVAGLGYSECYNIDKGFEGDPDENGHRGVVNGWKAANLPWRQS